MKHKTQTMAGNLRLSLMLFFGLVLFLCAGTMIANADTGNVETWGNETITETKTFDKDTTIVLNGNTVINVTKESEDAPLTAIDAHDVTLTIQGTGSLTVNGMIVADSFNMKGGKVNISLAKSTDPSLIFFRDSIISGGELTVVTPYAQGAIMGQNMESASPGSSAQPAGTLLTISGGAKVNVNGGMFAIFSPKIVIDNATVTSSANTAYPMPTAGIFSSDLQIRNGSHVKSSGSYVGIYSTGAITVDNSYVEAYAAVENMSSGSGGLMAPYGIACYGTSQDDSFGITIKNAKVTTPSSYKIGLDPNSPSGSSGYKIQTVLNTDGTPASKVIIEPVVQVTAAESAIMNALGVDAATAKAINAYAAKNGISADTLKITNKLLTTGNTDKDVKGSKFGLLQAYTKKIKKKAVTIKWKKVPGADGYMIYSNKCGKKNKCKLVKTLSASKTSFTSKKLKKGTYYKYVVVAYKNFNGTKVTITASPTIHAATLGGKYGVAKKVKITKVGKKKKAKITLKKGKKAKIKAKEIKYKKKIKKHRKLCYESSNTKVATVTKKGVIKAVAKGKCKIYVYAQNGVKKAVTVTVK